MSENVKQYLEQMVNLRRRVEGDRFADWRYQSMEALVLDLGKPFKRVPKPKGSGHRMGKMKHCFTNASRAVWRDSSLDYVEGYACSFIVCSHAWVTMDGAQAWDLTWPDDERHGRAEYLGIRWSRDFLRDTALETRFYGVLGSGDHNFIGRLLKDGPPKGAVL